MPDENPHLGSTLESLLRKDGTYEDAKNDAVRSVFAYKLEQAMTPVNDNEETTVQPLDEGSRLRGGQRPPPRSPRPTTNPVGQRPTNGGPSAPEATPPGPRGT